MTIKSEQKGSDKTQAKFNKVAGSKPKHFKDKKVGYANREDAFIGKRKFKETSHASKHPNCYFDTKHCMNSFV